MNVYVYNKFSSKYAPKLNGKIIKELKNIFKNLCIYDLKEFEEQYLNLDIKYLIVSGGDGTIHNIVNLLKDRLDDIIFGYIPTGTANDFGKNHNINSIKRALKVIRLGKINDVPLINVNERFSLYGVSVGRMSNVSLMAKNSNKKVFRKFIYMFKGIQYLFCKKDKIKLKINDEEYYKKLKALIIVNTKYLGGMKINKKLLTKELSILYINNIFDIIGIFIFGRFKTSKALNMQYIEIESDSIWCVDGEVLNTTKAKIQYSQNKIRLLSKKA